MTLENFLQKLHSTPTSITFAETMEVIDSNYHYTPRAFTNGELINEIGSNTGSCKLFAFAELQHLTKAATLHCFGEHYQSVLEDENGTSHQNIRNFMKTGFEGLSFKGRVLKS
ncbi:HopJ type III effector protein [Polaribacter sp. HL-MS24]|uniref:HopJ type III effector protein n=1 Tax=Polaribacter sp. HL-MS24 TaxID=3077735 RepID=UPI0029343AE3|nr:HopJ type III effector protein [Polaribacter sp. HL-MS24]WOC39314.1 HopJ type III effector protein [Polaribacter sp. HL-MS24]